MPGILTQLGKEPNSEDRDQEGENPSIMVGKAHYAAPPDFSESVRHELSFLEKINTIERGRPTLPPIKHSASPEPHLSDPLSHTFREPDRSSMGGFGNGVAPGQQRFGGRNQMGGMSGPSSNSPTVSSSPFGVPKQGGYGTSTASFSVGQQQQGMAGGNNQEIQLKSAIAAAVQKRVHEQPNPHDSSDRRPAPNNGTRKEESGKRPNQAESFKSTEGLLLPEGWVESTTKDGRVYFIDHVTRTTTWTDPRSVAVNGRYRVKDHQGNIQEMIVTSRIGNQMTVAPASQVQNGAQAGAPADFFEDPRKKAEERIRKKLREIKESDRPRNAKEIRENSHVVVTAAQRNQIHVKANTNSMDQSTKVYSFDKAFGPDANQEMVFDEVVSPMLDETGTGKTYTMEGDLDDSRDSGIIPRSLKKIFACLEDAAEYSVKISYVEIYNEELRDLLASDDSSVKLKIYEDSGKKGSNSIHGLEELLVTNTEDVMTLLQNGSNRRKVASTKMNETSSRSHSIFTVTMHIREATADGEDLLKVGKLNLVDLAGSENIGRSGAENRRAKEAGMINQSLLTLGRVINALVDKGAHIPYRESKLTRLLQDSLGGKTKTCIIAAVSPARCNFEETLSTLEYAHRAKNIRNKPEINQKMTKKALIRDYENQIEKLRADLQATREKNGIFLNADNYNQILNESESRKNQLEEVMKSLHEKEEYLVSVQTNFRDQMAILESTKSELKTTSIELQKQTKSLQDAIGVIETTNQSLEEQRILTNAHLETETMLQSLAAGLVSSLSETAKEVDILMEKIERKTAIEKENMAVFNEFQSQLLDDLNAFQFKVAETTKKQSLSYSQITEHITDYVTVHTQTSAHHSEQLETLTSSLRGHLAALDKNFGSNDSVMNDFLSKTIDQCNQLQTAFMEQSSLQQDSHAKIMETVQNSVKSLFEESMKSNFELTNYCTRALEAMQCNLKSHLHSQAKIEDLRKENARLTQLKEQHRNRGQKRKKEMMEALYSLIHNFWEEEEQDVVEIIDSAGATVLQHSERIQAFTMDFERESATLSNGMSGNIEILTNNENDVESMSKEQLMKNNQAVDRIMENIQEARKAINDNTKAQQIMDTGLSRLAEDTHSQRTSREYARLETFEKLEYLQTSLGILEDAQSEGLKNSISSMDEFNGVIQNHVRFLASMSLIQMKVSKAAETLKTKEEEITDMLESTCDHIRCKNLSYDRPTGKTPRRRKILIPSNLVRTRSHDELLGEYREKGHIATFHSPTDVYEFSKSSMDATADPLKENSKPPLIDQEKNSKLPRSRLPGMTLRRAESPFQEIQPRSE
ncbi:kinesin motor protein cin8 [Phlyctochytrium planicorne]|nr:kinesin motor protein cin8 [Phlyctochytrium planicorne]